MIIVAHSCMNPISILLIASAQALHGADRHCLGSVSIRFEDAGNWSMPPPDNLTDGIALFGPVCFSDTFHSVGVNSRRFIRHRITSP